MRTAILSDVRGFIDDIYARWYADSSVSAMGAMLRIVPRGQRVRHAAVGKVKTLMRGTTNARLVNIVMLTGAKNSNGKRTCMMHGPGAGGGRTSLAGISE